MTPSCTRHASVVLVAMALAAVPAAAQKRPITEKDLFKFVWVSDPQISPDGTRVAFVRVTIDEKKDQYESGIWLAKADGSEAPRKLTSGARDVAPRWSQDGKRLAFARAVEKDGRPQPAQIFVLSMEGGEARAITELPRGAGNPQWSPDGKTIAFASTTKPDDLKKEEEAKKTDKPPDKPRESDVRVITTAVYRANGVADFGYIETDRPSHIWTVAVPDAAAPLGAPKQITSGEFAENNFTWSPDGSRIYFVSDRVKESYYHPFDTDLYSVPAAGGEPTRVASIDGVIGDYEFSPDGKRIALIGTLHGNPVRSYSQPDLWVADLPAAGAAATPRNLTSAYDFDIGGGLSGDQRGPRGAHPSGPIWTGDGRAILVRVGEQGDANVKRIDVQSGKVEPFTTGHQDVMSYTAASRGNKLAAVVSSQTALGDLHAIDGASGSMKKLTSFNDELFNQLALSEPEELWYSSFDGKKIQAWVLKPPSFDRIAEASPHPANPRRPARRLRQQLHARVPMDGREGVRRALHEPAGQLELRSGVRQHHPVPVPRRRLQGPDGGRG